MTRQLYAKDHAERVLAPCVMDVIPHPEGNPAESYEWDRVWASAWWGFILHASRAMRDGVGLTKAGNRAWHLFIEETDRWQEAHP